jgi:hypothetical protein
MSSGARRGSPSSEIASQDGRSAGGRGWGQTLRFTWWPAPSSDGHHVSPSTSTGVGYPAILW